MISAPPAVWVAPSGPVVSERLLRFSMRFPQAQPLGLPAPVTLTRAGGAPIQGALLPDVLWSPDRRTATILLDPGRVKTGLLAREAAGPVLAADQAVDVRLGGAVVRRWRVAAGGCTPPDPATWRIESPWAGGRRPVLVRFPGAVDALSKDQIAIATLDGAPIAGRASLSEGEQKWRFQPARAWKAGAIRLVVSEAFETACGDRPGRPFEQRAGNKRRPPLGRTITVRAAGGPI